MTLVVLHMPKLGFMSKKADHAGQSMILKVLPQVMKKQSCFSWNSSCSPILLTAIRLLEDTTKLEVWLPLTIFTNDWILIHRIETWRNQGQLSKAAAFYEKGGHFREASDCFHSSGEYEQAIEVLRRSDEFDEIIHYIKRHGGSLNPNTLHRYSRLCNILLKQGRISTELRATTINLLGSDVEKLAFFKEFEMFDQMRSLYKDRRRWFEYYELSVAVGDLPGAMDTLLTQKLLPVIDKKTSEYILHYTMAETLLSH